MVARQEVVGTEPRCLDTLYRAHFDAVFSRCRRILRNEDDAADAAHEVFLRAFQLLPEGRHDGEIRSWLLTVARNHCIDVLRQRKRLVQMEGIQAAVPQSLTDPEHTVIVRHTTAAVLAGLHHRERQALWQSAVEDRPLAGIARNLGISYMAAAQVLHRARRRALLVAAQIASVLWIFNRRSPSGAGAAVRLAAVVAVPALALSISSARPVDQAAASVASPTVTQPHVTNAGPPGTSPVNGSAAPVPQSSAGTITSTITPSTLPPALSQSALSAALRIVDARLATLQSSLPIQVPSPVPTPHVP